MRLISGTWSNSPSYLQRLVTGEAKVSAICVSRSRIAFKPVAIDTDSLLLNHTDPLACV